MVLVRFLTLLAAVATATAFNIPPEVYKVTGLSEFEVRSLLSGTPAGLQARAATCPANDTSGGVVSGPKTPSALELLQRNAFVKRQGSKLTLLGQPFRMVGANIYWLGLDENVIPDPAYPSKTRVLEAFATVKTMLGTTVRGHTLGISVGNPLSVEPSLGVFNNAAYEAIDFAILVARIYNVKLYIPLVDNYNWYHGGKYQFIQWHGIPFSGTGADITPPDVGAFFYNTTAIVNSFKQYVTQHLNHVNQFTGIPLKDDPTILGWESGNELSAMRFGDGPAPTAWTKEIAALVKSLAPNHLFGDGSNGVFLGTDQFTNKQVDIFGDHYYPQNLTTFTTHQAAVTAAGRNYLAGEVDWKDGDLVTFFHAIAKTGTAGDFYWSLFGHDDACCNYVEHNDGFSFYYLRPNATNLYVNQGKILINHAAEMNGLAAPTKFPAVACPQWKFPRILVPPGLQL
ncbi:glycoside hydrolase [Rickenella mellea]|uniref:mannan endo-1,4-beta-mannosidase n=1 Tax=Rickenella mellea TaxID=50990 RepID=A0A4Y7QEK0_9AGAM|nr:glycoside hydrolase [Rickenella mellea]